MKAYIFGAGASHSYTKSVTGISPPLAKDFFKIYNQLDISGDLNVLIFAILSYIKETRGIDCLEFMNWNENMDEQY